MGFKFSHDRLILSLSPQKYQNFQNTSLLRFRFGHNRLFLTSFLWDLNSAMTVYLIEIQIGLRLFNPNNFILLFRLGHDRLSHYELDSATTIYLTKIQIQPRPFNPNSLSPRFRFGHYYLILSLSPKKYQNFQITSLGIQIRPWPFNPISFASKISKFPKYLSFGIQIWPRPFHPISFTSKIWIFFKNLSPRFRFGHDRLFLIAIL